MLFRRHLAKNARVTRQTSLRLFSILGLILLSILPIQTPNAAPVDPLGEVLIHITGLRSDNGRLLLVLFRSADGFPNVPEKAFAYLKGAISNHEAHISFRKVPYGAAAISVFHDENDNGKLDLNFMGIPTEGYGSSNNASGYFGPPKFEKAALSLQQPLLETDIKIKYWF